jgi:hypothetical protein
MQLESVISCPFCNHKKEETMPQNYCQWFYDCESCGEKLSPKKGDCCVYCSYGTVSCPPMQEGKSSCRGL